MCYSASTAPASDGANITGIGGINTNITYNSVTQNKNLYTGSVIFTSTGTGNSYYAYAGLGSMTGTSIFMSVELNNMVRIA